MNLTVSPGQDSGWVVTAVAAEDISDWGGWRSQACSMAAKRPKRAKRGNFFALRYAKYREAFSWYFGLCIASNDNCFGSQR